MHKGSCLCGAVRYELRAELGPIVLCHCAHCRKAHGTAFAAVSPVPAESLEFRSGAAALREYESSPGKVRVFCGTCGSPIISKRRADSSTVRLRIGTLDTPVAQRPAAHIWTASKADWHTIDDRLPQHARFEPTRAPGKSR